MRITTAYALWRAASQAPRVPVRAPVPSGPRAPRARGTAPRASTGAGRPRPQAWPRSRRLSVPPLDQFALQRTYWEARWKPALAKVREGLRRPDAADLALAHLTAAVLRASERGRAPSPEGARELAAAQALARASLAGAGAPQGALEALDRHHRTFLSWWKESGRTACALAVMRLGQLSGSTDTGFGKVLSGFTRTDVRSASWYPDLASTPGAPSRPKLYRGRSVTYDLRYDAQRLRFAAATILGKLNQGQTVHVQVLTGYLHRDAGPGRPPASTHSLALVGYQVEKAVGTQPVRVAFQFVDPDGGGQGILRLDIEQQSFQHVPAVVGWLDTGDGWDYDSTWPPHRYQVTAIR